MYTLINAAFSRTRLVILALLAILLAGAQAYTSIPKEAEPDVTIPTIYVSLVHEGISPKDAERLLLRPMEQELRAIPGLEEIRSVGSQGHASLTLEFDAGFDPDEALRDVREKVDVAKSELPSETEEPRVQEINPALFPVLTVALSGSLPERELLARARTLRDALEGISSVLEVDIAGDRESVVDIIVDPHRLQAYDLSFDEVLTRVRRNNRLVAAGAVESEAGNISVQVPGVIESYSDVQRLPLKVDGEQVVTFGDVGSIYRTFKDPNGFARVNGEPAIALEVKKRVGANIIETVEEARQIIGQHLTDWEGDLQADYLQDKSKQTRDMLGDLQNNVISAIFLVMVVAIIALGPRPALLVGVAIPGSFLAGILAISALGYTLNIVVLFSLILVVGMLVDGAIITVELADRRLSRGMDGKTAYAGAAKRMAWPIIASTATTLAVFVPLLFWPGIVGEFMKYLPATVIVTLGASLFMALVFVPVLGGLLTSRLSGKSTSEPPVGNDLEDDDLEVVNEDDRYYRVLKRLLLHPGKTLMGAMAFLIGTYIAYGSLGNGLEFFPEVEPETAQVQVRARGNLSVYERDAIVREVEQRLIGLPGVKSLYTRTYGKGGVVQNRAEDVIGTLQLIFTEWDQRRPAKAIIAEVRKRTADLPGIVLQVQEAASGPTAGKPIEVEVSSPNPRRLASAIEEIRLAMNHVGGFVDVEDSRPLEGVEWRLRVDREQAARVGADIALLGEAVQLTTNGILLGEYRPEDVDDSVDIRIRFPFRERTIERLQSLHVPTENGQVPVKNFVDFEASQPTGAINRVNGQRIMAVKANVDTGLLPDTQTRLLSAQLDTTEIPEGVLVRFKGEDKDLQESIGFLLGAFAVAIVLMLAALVAQFNSFYQAFVVLSAIVFSTAGVLLGLLVTGNPFGVVMGGIGVIALAGIVVNNNIVLIDTYNRHRAQGIDPQTAILQTALQRRRPVLLTALTTILGVMPMVIGLNADLAGRELSFGAPSTQWWKGLASAIAGGLTFATVLTLVLTPCLLMLGSNTYQWLTRGRSNASISDQSLSLASKNTEVSSPIISP
ncbi:acriflavin resistance protein [Luminiphilus syltensis NOR5-1B]|uniref:Acriflavin resistance protein n=1 Tax=Luminiphilus syltensis NOR5-1B TaxID=565045 RepID=B8KX83_9GAMM|nr:efflux RND transporter permease subunit [Luminiphilus syltensis]EED35209.1 acriflavin resistance protein [Luminiphilus syltensis NOR5-1B]